MTNEESMNDEAQMTDDNVPKSDSGLDEAGADPSLEDRLARLEEILARMESEEIALEEALGLFEEGIAHVRRAERTLSETELKVEELLADGTTRPLDTDDA